jgi:hypothetical protein
MRRAPCPDDSGIVVDLGEHGKPPGLGMRVVVEERDDIAGSGSNAGVPRVGQTPPTAVLYHLDIG